MPGPNQKPDVAPDDLPTRAGVDWDGIADEADDISDEELETVDELTDFDDEADEDVDEADDNDDNPYQESDEALPDDDEEAAIRDYNRREAGESY